MTFEPLNITSSDWGRLQLIIGNKDLTFYRNIPTRIQSWSSGEPFDDRQAAILFPGITSYETVANLPFKEFDNVEIWLVNSSNVKVKCLWEGFIGSFSDSLSESDNGLTVECIGALYQADFFLKAPNFGFAPEDAGFSIANEMNLRAKYYGLRFKQMNWLTYTSIPVRNQGSWNELLTGWTQELLSSAYSPAFMFDGEQANCVQSSEDGYWVVGDHGTYCVFGDTMPNYGSTTWFNAIFIHLFNNPGLYVNDVYYDPVSKIALGVTRGGYVGDRQSLREETVSVWKGDRRNSPTGVNWNAIHGVNSCTGYRIMSNFGQVACYGTAAHYGDGPALGPAYYQTGGILNDLYVDMERTASGNGYWLLSWGGRIRAFGDAWSTSDVTLVDTPIVGISATPDGTGLFILDAKGRVSVRGSAVYRGQPGPIDITNANFRDICSSPTGNGYIITRSDGAVYTYGDQVNYGTALFTDSPTAGGNVSQYTMMKYTGRRPIIRTKDTWTTDWTYTVGTPGVTHDLTRDRTVMYNTFYGEGVDQNNCKWRNTKYPNFIDDINNNPVYPGYNFSMFVNQNAPAVVTWQRRMQQNGYPINPDGYFDGYDASICKKFQAAAGILVDGIVGPQTWTATFDIGSSGGDLRSAYIAPLAIDRRVEPFTYNANGSITGNNAYFDKSMMRIEKYSNYGEKSSKREATISSLNELKRNGDPGYAGTLTLKIDPEEGSRFEMKAGQNVLYKGYRGIGILLHISAVEIDFESQTVTLTVDSKARDLMTVSAMIERNRNIGEAPLERTRPQSSTSKQIDEKVVFDCESKAGFIPYLVTPKRLWNVIRIPVGEIGTVVKTELTTALPAAKFSIGVFDRKITANELAALGNPTDTEDYWKNFPEDRGLIISWGQKDQMCGYYPGGESEEDPLTGRFVDTGSWNFWTEQPPWIYIAIWAEERAFISGRIYPGADAGFNFASIDAIANPMEITPTSRPTVAYYGAD